MFSSRSYIIPAFASLLLHGLLIAVILYVKPSDKDKPKINKPNYVNAQLIKLKEVSKKPLKPKKKPIKKVDLTKQKKEAVRKKREAEKKARELKKKKAQDAEKKRKAEALRKKEQAAAAKRKKQAAATKAKEDAKKKEEEIMARELEDEFAQALAAEEQQLQAEAMDMEASSFIAVISERIAQKWSRPASARKGMTCVLKIRLVPTGKVVTVNVLESSGNDAFDRSAIQAVRAVDQFHELKGLDSALFEKHFREMTLLFNPEDRRL